MKAFAIAAIALAIVLFATQALLRRAFMRARVAGLRAAFDEVSRFDVDDISGTIEGTLHGRNAGIAFVQSTTRGKADAKSTIEVWCECRVRIPFRAQGRPNALFNREFDVTSSQPELMESFQTRPEVNAALEALAQAGAEAVYANRDRIGAIFRPFQRALITREAGAAIFDHLESLARQDEATA